MKKFYYFRALLVNSAQNPLLSSSFQKTKNQLLQELFTQDFEFAKRGKEYVYRYISSNEDLVFARIGTKKSLKVTPSSDLKEVLIDHWQARSFFLDFNERNSKGQEIAIELQNNSPTIIDCIAEAINTKLKRDLENPYRLEINPEGQACQFWDIIDKEKVIVSLEVKTTAPNLFKDKSPAQDEMKAAQEMFNATEMTNIVKNADGNLLLNREDPYVMSLVDNAMKGGGRIKVSGIHNKIIYNSSEENSIRSKDIDIEEMDIDLSNMSDYQLTLIWRKLFGE